MPVKVIYCPVCQQPYEYCMYSKTAEVCKQTLYTTNEGEYGKIYGSAAPPPPPAPGSEEKKEDEGEAKKKKKHVAFTEPKNIVVFRTTRGKRNFLTIIYGLHLFGLKKFYNLF